MNILKISLLLGLVPSLSLGAPEPMAKEASTNRFFTNYDTKTESLEAGNKLNEQIIEEGITLLKNEDNVLPLAKSSKVSIFGNYSTDLIYTGAGSGAGSGGETITLQQVFQNAGLQVNPELTEFYDNDSLSGGIQSQIQGYTVNAGYKVFETPVSKLEANVDETSYEEYNDVAFVVISRRGMEAADLPKGMATGFSGEGLNSTKVAGARNADDHSLQPNQDETDLIEYVSQYFDNIVLLFNTGSQFEAGFLDDVGHYAYSDKIKGALWFGFPGRGDGLNALGKILTGEVSPSGHTVDTWARDFKNDPTWDNMPIYSNSLIKYTNSSKSFVNYKEGIYAGYRYYETRGETEGEENYSSLVDGRNVVHNTETTQWDSWYDSAVVFPMGYGLSYTTFDWEIVGKSIEENSPLPEDGSLSVQVKVTNTGEVAGKDVVQLYYSAPYTEGGIEKSSVNLAAYAKTDTLDPGESEVLTLEIATRDMASYDYNDANKNEFIGYELDPGEYHLHFSKNAHESVLDLTYTVPEGGYRYETSESGTKIENLFADAEMENTVYLSRSDWEGTFPTKPTAEERVAPQEVLDIVENTSSSEKILANDDPSDPWYAEEMPTVGNNTGSIMLEDLYGLPYDNPLWEDYLDQFAVGSKTERGMAYTFWNAGWNIYGVDELGFPTTHQEDGPSGLAGRYVGGTYTNFACETVLASTWNKSLAYQKGLLIGNQGLFGDGTSIVSGLYAPSVNLHRSPFGGRNFEYYSEDPYLSGEMAGNIIKGCNEKGMITYLKHFAVNEQESNRENLLTWANEQSIRELYVKPFQICVEDYHTHGIMSALNNLGATWTGGHYNLLTRLLREEWGFDGIVITDYVQSRPQLNGNLALRTGGDILLATNGSQQNPAGLDSPTTVKSLRRAMHNVLYNTLNYTAIFNSSIVNILGEYEDATLDPAIAEYDYSASLATCLTNDGSNSREVVRYSLKEGETLPEGLTLAEDGTLSGKPTKALDEPAVFTVQAKYEHSTREATFTLPVVDKDLSVIYTKPTGQDIATGYIGESYQQNIAWAYLASGEEQKITYSLADGSLLPEGLSLTEGGAIQGTPTKPCVNYAFRITASSEGKLSMSVNLNITIGQRIAVTDKTLKTGKANEYYADSITIDQDGLKYELTSESSLPNGLTLTEDGNIVGTPTSAVSGHAFTVHISGENYIATDKIYYLDIGLNYADFTLDSIKVGQSVNLPINFAQGGNSIVYSLAEGSALPEGLELKDGSLVGSVSKAGSYSFTIQASMGGVPTDSVTVQLLVEPTQTYANYQTGMIIGIVAIVLCAAGIVVFFLVFDRKNRSGGNGNDLKDNGTDAKEESPEEKEEKEKVEKRKKRNFLATVIGSVSGFVVFGTAIVLCITLLAPQGEQPIGGSQVYVFEAEYVYLDEFNGAGISNSAEGVNNIYGEGTEADIEKGYSNGYFLGNTYAANQIDFVIESDAKTTGKLTLRLASELGDLSLNNDVFGVEVNGEAVDYSIIVQNSSSGSYDFSDYTLNTSINLVEGENTVSLIIKENTLQGGNRTGAPLIDCIKIATEATLTWEPLLDNPDRIGEV